MKPSLKGGYLPETRADYVTLEAHGGLRNTCCIECKEPFSDANTHSAPGWRDTQIVGLCEDCYDAMWEEDNEGGVL